MNRNRFDAIRARRAMLVASSLMAMTLWSPVRTEAVTFTWSQTAGGAQSWSTAGNWNPAAVPNPVSGDTVDFSTANIAADTTLSLDADRTATIWKFGDNPAGQNWIVSAGNQMILAGATPTINVVNGSVRLNNVVAGSAGLTKTGTGTLTLAGSNIYSGGTTLNGGTVAITNANSFGTGNVTVAGSTQITSTIGVNYANDIAVNAVLSLRVSATGTSTYSGVLSGSGNISLVSAGLGGANTGTHAFTNTGNTFTGNVILPSATGSSEEFSFASIGDGGNFTFSRGSWREAIIYTGAANITFNSRQINLASTIGGASGVDGNGRPINQFQNNGAGTVTFNTNMIVPGSSASSTFFTFSGSNTGNNTFAGTIADIGGANTLGIAKFNAGKWILTGANSYQGNTWIADGTLSVNALATTATNQPLGLGSLILLGNQGTSGTLEFTGAADSTTDKQVRIGNTTVNQAGAGSIVNNGAGTMTFSNATFNPAIAGITATRTLTLGGSNTGANTIEGTIQNNAAGGLVAITKTGAGKWVLAGDNTYTGETIIAGGILNVASLSDYGVASAIGARTLAQENNTGTGIGLHFRGGTLQYTGSTAQSTNRQIRMLNGNGATIDASGSDPAATLSFTYSGANINLFDTAGTRTLTLTGTNTGDNTFAIQVTNQSTNATSLVKNGTGKWVLTNSNNTYTGLTTINQGTLEIGTPGSIAGSAVVNSGGTFLVNGTVLGDVDVNGGGTLGGNGTVNGNVNVNGGTTAPGNSPGVLTVGGDLTYNTGSSVTWQLIDNTTAGRGSNFDGIDVGADLDFAGATGFNLDFADGASNVLWSDAFWDLSYVGINGWLVYDVAGSTSNFSNLAIVPLDWQDGAGNLFSAFRAGSFFSLVQDGNDIYLNYTFVPQTTVPEPATVTLGLLAFGGMMMRRRRMA